jgi:hypothetical protein
MKYLIMLYGSQRDYDMLSGKGAEGQPAWSAEDLGTMVDFMRDWNNALVESGEFVDGQVDVHGLYILAVLVDAFWSEPSASLAAEIRLQRQCFGLTPIDRRRLQWEIDRGEDASERTRKRRATPATGAEKNDQPPTADPRGVLHVV